MDAISDVTSHYVDVGTRLGDLPAPADSWTAQFESRLAPEGAFPTGYSYGIPEDYSEYFTEPFTDLRRLIVNLTREDMFVLSILNVLRDYTQFLDTSVSEIHSSGGYLSEGNESPQANLSEYIQQSIRGTRFNAGDPDDEFGAHAKPHSDYVDHTDAGQAHYQKLTRFWMSALDSQESVALAAHSHKTFGLSRSFHKTSDSLADPFDGDSTYDESHPHLTPNVHIPYDGDFLRMLTMLRMPGFVGNSDRWGLDAHGKTHSFGVSGDELGSLAGDVFKNLVCVGIPTGFMSEMRRRAVSAAIQAEEFDLARAYRESTIVLITLTE